jgi:hypothetical protein
MSADRRNMRVANASASPSRAVTRPLTASRRDILLTEFGEPKISRIDGRRFGRSKIRCHVSKRRFSRDLSDGPGIAE